MGRVIYGDRMGQHGSLTVGCSAAIFDAAREKILLVRRVDNDRWCVPGGYMEAGEGVTEGCEREVFEETGLQGKVQRLIGVYTNPNILVEYPDGNKWQFVALFFLVNPVGGQLMAGDEAVEAGYFTQEETELLEMSSFDRQRIADAFAAQEITFIRDDIFVEPD